MRVVTSARLAREGKRLRRRPSSRPAAGACSSLSDVPHVAQKVSSSGRIAAPHVTQAEAVASLASVRLPQCAQNGSRRVDDATTPGAAHSLSSGHGRMGRERRIRARAPRSTPAVRCSAKGGADATSVRHADGIDTTGVECRRWRRTTRLRRRRAFRSRCRTMNRRCSNGHKMRRQSSLASREYPGKTREYRARSL